MSILERILCAVLKHRDIVKEIDGERVLYLRRFFLWRYDSTDETGDTGGLFIHHICLSDRDRDPHDHPWDFATLILKGGYTDENWPIGYYGSAGFHRDSAPVDTEAKPGRAFVRSAEYAHRVRLAPGKTAWTLVFTGPCRRVWGFWTAKGRRRWDEYLQENAPEQRGG